MAVAVAGLLLPHPLHMLGGNGEAALCEAGSGENMWCYDVVGGWLHVLR